MNYIMTHVLSSSVVAVRELKGPVRPQRPILRFGVSEKGVMLTNGNSFGVPEGC